jgi:hypothetical protein
LDLLYLLLAGWLLQAMVFSRLGSLTLIVALFMLL